MAHIRQATESDLASIEALLRASGLPTEGVALYLPHFVVADAASGIVGCGGIEFHGRHALVRSIAVVEHARRAGLGQMLVARLLAECRARAIQSVGLLTTTAEDYFADQGFVRIVREAVPQPLLASSQFQGVCPGSAVAMLLVCDDKIRLD
ncbi:arsenic resistance N-acetyltransferase ArsN2 [Burkholderia cenocepacia]|uniref:GNAT family N-acetyltransferase n=1 Tax=Burkholderia cenocepacia TaxID=95486 RepID=A0A1V2VTU7_9BURK|nr:arsenic resistance N-acetyltransferase ArsN2 [Burkholderia cenocepacia]MBN3503084.1 GNAT family N-acetyltransferase [Burkholderia cenocepacia]MBR7965323.1 GNAT family N-acetyltransferase [Burkholderia cenocepacia]MBR8247276.1 GNAT family N-acetyltransferase [Burkholderia cenocepacia]MBR8285295.1 GNAT family N-acetyltransferase [Burkholderia cenocepacia]MBR8500712.1 GNAT family N-acetyltransferase [Burkholderia cenocepacia]